MDRANGLIAAAKLESKKSAEKLRGSVKNSLGLQSGAAPFEATVEILRGGFGRKPLRPLSENKNSKPYRKQRQNLITSVARTARFAVPGAYVIGS